MRPIYTVEAPSRAPQIERRRLGWGWLPGVLIGLAALVLLGISLLAFNWPFTKQAIIDALQEGSVRSVTVGRFYRTYWPPGCVAENISFLHRKHKNKPPLITIRKLTIVGSYGWLCTLQRRLSIVRVDGMHVTVPPSAPDGAPNPVMPVMQKAAPSMKIGTVIADGTVLDFLPTHPGKASLHLVVNKLTLDGVGKNQPLSYRATVFNSKPPGEIQSSGRFGPWNPDNPGHTAVSGSYAFRNANLAFFKTISGTLFSTGKFSGVLNHLDVAGTSDTANFHVSDTSHSRQLTTEFHALVDATNGDTFLHNVVAHFDRTTVASEGDVAGEDTKISSLDISAANGRIEDLLNLFISAKRPPMTGSVSFRAHVDAQPQSQAFLRTLRLVGDFGVGAGKFTNTGTQNSIGRLSESAQKAEKGEHSEDPATVLSNLKGHVVVRDGIATFSNLSFSVPGANARMNGTYSLIDYKVDLHGTLMTSGKVSDATSGFKSVLVKAISPLFKRKASVKIVPFKITGKYQHTIVSLDLGRKNK